MSKFIVFGGKKLNGTYPVSGAKNAAPKLLITSMLSGESCTYHNISRFSDTFRSIDAITAMGGSVRFSDFNTVEINCKNIINSEIPLEAMSARQNVLFIGATLARMGRVKIYSPKGDAIGKRPLNRHLDGIKALGGIITEKNNRIEIEMHGRPKSTTYTFEKNTHMGTENLIVASVFNTGKIILKNSAEEPEVDNLIECLNKMGARIKRVEPRTIEIIGVEPLLHGVEFASMPDRLESATALTLSLLTGGGIKITNSPRKMLEPFVTVLENIGIELNWEGDTVSVSKINLPLKPTAITTNWHPGFVTDWQPLMTLLLATASSGQSIIHERIFENRWNFLSELSKMGVKYELFQPEGFLATHYNFNDAEYDVRASYGAKVNGPTVLQPAEVISHDVRAGIDMLLASLATNGKSIIHDPHNHIDRGYENIVEKLTNLGADIKRV